MWKVWNLRGEELLHRDDFWMNKAAPGGIYGFVDSEHLLVRGDSKKKPQEFAILDLHGQVVDRWTAPKQWTLVDISPDRHLLAVLSEHSLKTLVVDYPTKKIVLTKDNPRSFGDSGGGSSGGPWQFFAEGGRTLCSVGSVAPVPTPNDTQTLCWDVDSGQKIAQFDGFPGGAPAAASSHGSRLVLTGSASFAGKKVQAITATSGQRVVWDFRSGSAVAAWGMSQAFWLSASRGPGIPEPGPVAISSSGHYVAEANGVLLRIYELP